MATYAGQNVGAGKLDRIKAGLKSSSIIGCIYAVIAFLILVFFSDKIALLFMDAGETETIRQVSMFLIANSAFYIPLVFVNVVRFTIQGMGYSTSPFWRECSRWLPEVWRALCWFRLSATSPPALEAR